MTASRSALVAALALAAGACDKVGPQQLTAVAPAARVKFFNFGTGAPGVNFYANDTKVTAIGSATGSESALGTAYGASAAGGFYTSLPAGQYTFTGRVAAATDNGLAVASLPATLSDGKAYSLYLSGPYNAAAKKVDAFVVEDSYPQQVSSDTIYVRFVNAISNAGPLTLYFRSTTTSAVGQASVPVAYKAAGGFLAIPFSGLGVTDVLLRAAGATANLATLTNVSFGSGRVYTITARGDATVTSSTAANRPQLDNTANY